MGYCMMKRSMNIIEKQSALLCKNQHLLFINSEHGNQLCGDHDMEIVEMQLITFLVLLNHHYHNAGSADGFYHRGHNYHQELHTIHSSLDVCFICYYTVNMWHCMVVLFKATFSKLINTQVCFS